MAYWSQRILCWILSWSTVSEIAHGKIKRDHSQNGVIHKVEVTDRPPTKIARKTDRVQKPIWVNGVENGRSSNRNHHVVVTQPPHVKVKQRSNTYVPKDIGPLPSSNWSWSDWGLSARNDGSREIGTARAIIILFGQSARPRCLNTELQLVAAASQRKFLLEPLASKGWSWNQKVSMTKSILARHQNL